ncbi:MAG: lysylphosphatidylglycerol synthase domain-containing protein [Myxococcota bacterium]
MAALALAGLGVGCWRSLRGADPATARALAAEARWGWVAAAVAGFAANHALRVVRWHLLLDARIPLRRDALVCLVAFLAITTLPLRLGELVRPALLAREGVPVGRTLAALVAERALDVAALAGLLLWAATGPDLPALRVEGTDVLALARPAAAVALGVLLAGLAAVTVAGDRLAGLPVVGPTAAAMAQAGRDLARRPARALGAAALTAATWLAIGAYVRGGLAVLPSLPQSWEAAAVVWAGVMATINVLPTPGFFGSYEAGAAAALALYGVPTASGGVWALGLHAGYVAFVAALGLPALLWLRHRGETGPAAELP